MNKRKKCIICGSNDMDCHRSKECCYTPEDNYLCNLRVMAEEIENITDSIVKDDLALKISDHFFKKIDSIEDENLKMKILLGECRLLLGSLIETRNDSILGNLKSFIKPILNKIIIITDIANK